MSEDKHIIWSNYDLDYEDWRADLEAEYPELSEDERISLMYEINGHYLDDERMNLNVQLSQPIGCSYCYARNNVRRFHMIDDFENPQYFPGKLRLMEKARPQIFLLTGMSDFSGWRPEWRDEVFAKMERNPQHQYLFLTKRSEEIDFYTHLDNAWFGVTVTSSKEKNRITTLREHIRAGHYPRSSARASPAQNTC